MCLVCGVMLCDVCLFCCVVLVVVSFGVVWVVFVWCVMCVDVVLCLVRILLWLRLCVVVRCL